MSKKVIWILHAGISHKSPYFYNLTRELKKYDFLDVVINPSLPVDKKTDNGIVYFNRLKRFYKSEDSKTIDKFLKDVDNLKENGWKIIFTLHNFFPIDREINDNDAFLLQEFLKRTDMVFTFSNHMKNQLKKYFNIDAYNHSIGENILNDDFDNDIELPKLPEDAFVFTFIGNISEYKMLNVVIDNFFKLLNKYKNAYLIIAGPSNKTYNLKIKNNRNIIRIDQFIGDKEWEKLASLTNVFLNTYDINRECFKYGFFPSNCITIMKYKKFCIAPDCLPIKEILPIEYYYLYSDKNDLLTKMKLSIKNKDIIKNKEKNYPKSNYSWEKTVKILVDKIGELK